MFKIRQQCCKSETAKKSDLFKMCPQFIKLKCKHSNFGTHVWIQIAYYWALCGSERLRIGQDIVKNFGGVTFLTHPVGLVGYTAENDCVILQTPNYAVYAEFASLSVGRAMGRATALCRYLEGCGQTGADPRSWPSPVPLPSFPALKAPGCRHRTIEKCRAVSKCRPMHFTHITSTLTDIRTFGALGKFFP